MQTFHQSTHLDWNIIGHTHCGEWHVYAFMLEHRLPTIVGYDLAVCLRKVRRAIEDSSNHGRFDCKDCGDGSAEFYGPMLRDELWKEVADYEAQYLCSKCVETRLGRPLQSADIKPSELSQEWWARHR